MHSYDSLLDLMDNLPSFYEGQRKVLESALTGFRGAGYEPGVKCVENCLGGLDERLLDCYDIETEEGEIDIPVLKEFAEQVLLGYWDPQMKQLAELRDKLKEDEHSEDVQHVIGIMKGFDEGFYLIVGSVKDFFYERGGQLNLLAQQLICLELKAGTRKLGKIYDTCFEKKDKKNKAD